MTSSPYTTLILIALMVVAFYFLIIRPNKKRQQAQQNTLRALTPGTRVLLGSGIFGTLVSIGEKQAVLELSPGNNLTVLKAAITRAVRDTDEDTAWETFDDDELDPIDDLDDSEQTTTPPTSVDPVRPETTQRDITPSELTSPPGSDSSSLQSSSDQEPRSGTNTGQNKE